jgi:hypothetical protein
VEAAVEALELVVAPELAVLPPAPSVDVAVLLPLFEQAKCSALERSAIKQVRRMVDSERRRTGGATLTRPIEPSRTRPPCLRHAP